MKLKENLIKIYKNDRAIFGLLLLNFLLALTLFVFSLTHLNPESSVVKIGYGDIGGYRDGTWVDMLSFTLLSVILGPLHDLLAVRILKKRGRAMTIFFLVVTILLVLGAFLVFIRLLGEG